MNKSYHITLRTYSLKFCSSNLSFSNEKRVLRVGGLNFPGLNRGGFQGLLKAREIQSREKQKRTRCFITTFLICMCFCIKCQTSLYFYYSHAGISELI